MMQTYLEDTEPIQRRLTVGEVDVLCQPERVESEVAYHGPVQRGGALKERQRLALRHHNGARRRGGCIGDSQDPYYEVQEESIAVAHRTIYFPEQPPHLGQRAHLARAEGRPAVCCAVEQ